MLLEAGKLIDKSDHEVVFVMTRKAAEYYTAREKDFIDFCRSGRIPFIDAKDPSEVLGQIAQQKADVCISVNWPNLLPQHVIDLFPFGILNAHAGDLPRYRGNACQNWAILNFESQIALTIHKMTSELDAGPYIRKSYFALDTNTYITDVYEWLEAEIPRLFLESLEALELEEPIPQRLDAKVLRTFPRIPSDSKIVWSDSAKNILALIRASSRPFHGAYCFLNNGLKILRIFRASSCEVDYDYLAMPGTICEIQDGKPIVSTGSGLIVIEDFCFDGMSQDESGGIISKSMRNRLT